MSSVGEQMERLRAAEREVERLKIELASAGAGSRNTERGVDRRDAGAAIPRGGA